MVSQDIQRDLLLHFLGGLWEEQEKHFAEVPYDS
jgi:hypothetical protein